MSTLEVYVYCPICKKTNRVRVEPPGNIQQYAINHGDHVIVFTVDKYGAVRSIHTLKVLQDSSASNSFEDYAIVEGNVVKVVTLLNSEIVTLEEIPIIAHEIVGRDIFWEGLQRGGETLILSVIIGVALGIPVRANGEVNIAKELSKLLGEPSIEISEEQPEYRLEDFPYLGKAIKRIMSENDPDQRVFIARQIVSTLKAIVNFIVRNIDNVIVQQEIRDILGGTEREDLRLTIINLVKLVDKATAEKLIAIFMDSTE